MWQPQIETTLFPQFSSNRSQIQLKPKKFNCVSFHSFKATPGAPTVLHFYLQTLLHFFIIFGNKLKSQQHFFPSHSIQQCSKAIFFLAIFSLLTTMRDFVALNKTPRQFDDKLVLIPQRPILSPTFTLFSNKCDDKSSRNISSCNILINQKDTVNVNPMLTGRIIVAWTTLSKN